MKNPLVLTTILILFHVQINAQEILDTSYLECFYKYTLMQDTIEHTKRVKDGAMILLIGNKYSKFYSYNMFVRDSIAISITDAEKMTILSDMGRFAQQYPGGETYKVYKNYKENRIIFTDKQGGRFKSLYNEHINKQDWKILNETKEISGYKCQKATCTFRGRNYEAWFTLEIIVNEGPWKFNGLPGLIVKVYDTKEHYDFELYSIQKVKKPIVFNEQDYTKVSRIDYITMQKRFISNPLEMFSGISIKNNDGTSIQTRARNYDVMERDIK